MTKTIDHPLLPEDVQPRALVREIMLARKGQLAGPAARPMYDDLIARTPTAPGVTFEAAKVGGVDGWWCTPPEPLPDAAILYLHGGAYILGTAKAYRPFASQVARAACTRVFVADYRLAPEHPFPAALDDTTTAYRALTTIASAVVVMGDSAGGGLSLALLAQRETHPPRGAVVLSPWVDLLGTGESNTARAEQDAALTMDTLRMGSAPYAGNHDLHDPRLSPLYGELAGLPPVQIHVGEDEILFDDSTRYAARFRKAGGDCELHTWAGMAHVFPRSVGTFRAADLSLAEIGRFARERLSAT